MAKQGIIEEQSAFTQSLIWPWSASNLIGRAGTMDSEPGPDFNAAFARKCRKRDYFRVAYFLLNPLRELIIVKLPSERAESLM
jgi:hypothetical protein